VRLDIIIAVLAENLLQTFRTGDNEPLLIKKMPERSASFFCFGRVAYLYLINPLFSIVLDQCLNGSPAG
jgi:hypothetical protein